MIHLSNRDAQHNGYADRGHVDPLMSGDRSPNVVHGFCAGTGVPGSGCSYTACAVWRAEKQRIEAGRAAGQHGLRDEQADRAPASRPSLAEARAGRLFAGPLEELG